MSKKRLENSILVKVIRKPEHVAEFVSGKIYMNTNMKFAAEETKQTMSKGQHDYLEDIETYMYDTDEYVTCFKVIDDCLYLVREKRAVVEREHGKRKGPGVIALYSEPLNLFCMYAITYDMENKTVTKVSSKIEKEFGQYAVIIKDFTEFLDAVSKAIDKLDYNIRENLKYDFVNYFDKNEVDGYKHVGAYDKTSDYDYQNEFRLSVGLEGYKEALILDIGDISHIVNVVPTRDLETITIDDEYINIGNLQLKLPNNN